MTFLEHPVELTLNVWGVEVTAEEVTHQDLKAAEEITEDRADELDREQDRPLAGGRPDRPREGRQERRRQDGHPAGDQVWNNTMFLFAILKYVLLLSWIMLHLKKQFKFAKMVWNALETLTYLLSSNTIWKNSKTQFKYTHFHGLYTMSRLQI